MAKRRRKGQWFVLFLLMVYVLLIVLGVFPNPLPGVWAWIDRERPIAPDIAWQERLGARPAEAAVAGDAVVVTAGGSSRLYDRSTGQARGEDALADWVADWVVPAGTGDDAVLLTGSRLDGGYEVRDPGTGRLLADHEHAVAAWGFTNGWLALWCEERRVCQLRSYTPGRQEPEWRTDLPGRREDMLGGHPTLTGPRTPEAVRIAPRLSTPGPRPVLMAFTTTRSGDDLHVVVRTATGDIVGEVTPGDDERVILAGDRLVRSTTERYESVCVGEVTGYDPVSRTPVWGPATYHLWGTGGSGCTQRERPVGQGAVLAALTADGRPVVLGAYDGRELWRGARGEVVAAVSADHAVIREAESPVRYGVRLGGDGQRLWEHRLDDSAELALADCGVVAADRRPDRLYVWDPATGEERISLPTDARLLACGPDGVVLAQGRSVGFARFDDVTSDDGDREARTMPRPPGGQYARAP